MRAMRRRTFLSLPVLAAPVRAADRLNVVIILADDLGTADVGFRGSEIKTPNIDRIAREGVQFDRFYSYPVCSPTRSGLMTGRSPMRYGVIYSVVRPWAKIGLPESEHLMPESFRSAGYQTAMAGKWHLGHAASKYMPNARGFEHAYGHVNGAIDYFTHVRDGGLDWHRDGKTVREEGYSTDLVSGEASRIIKSRDRSRPLFLYLPFNAPHAPLQAPEDAIAKYSSITDRNRRLYAAMVDRLDAGVGRVLEALDQAGMSKNTLVLFFSDNGGPTNLGARNQFRGAKASTFEGGIRVPAALRLPGQIQPGTTSKQVMTVLDVFPTLAGAAGVTPRNQQPLDGRNLWPEVSRGRQRPREDLFFAVENAGMTHLAVHHGEWKLVRQVPSKGGEAVNMLFRIDDDPGEKRDLAGEHPDRVKDLVSRIEKWQALHPAEGTRFAAGAPAGWKSPPQWAEAAR